MSISTQLAFDYGDIPAVDSKALERHADNVLKIQERQRRTSVENALKLGEELKAAQERLSNHGNGTFGKWCVERCGISYPTAARMIHIYESVPDKDSITVRESFDLTALYKLLSDTCPEEAYRDALKLAKKGEQVTAKAAKEIIAEYTVGDDEPASTDDQEESDQTPEYEPAQFSWQPADFVTATRRHVREWINRCPPHELHFIYDTLRDLAAQIERKANGNSEA